MKFTKEDIEGINRCYDLINAARFPQHSLPFEIWNRVYADEIEQGKKPHKNPTNCGACIRNAVLELKRDLDAAFRLTPEEERQQEIKRRQQEGLKKYWERKRQEKENKKSDKK